MLNSMPNNQFPEKQAGCLSDELIAQWVRGLIPQGEQWMVQRHLKDCLLCRELVETAIAVENTVLQREISPSPAALSQGARQLVGRLWESKIAEIVLKITDGLYSAAQTTGKILHAPWLSSAELLRSQDTAMPSIVVIESIYKHLRCRIESSIIEPGRHTLKASFVDIPSGLPVNRISVVLFLVDEEIESQESIDGRVSFDDLLPGAYLLELNLPDGLKGQLSFHLMPS